MAHRFQNRIVLVTGGNSGIGRAAALAFAGEGAAVVIAARDAESGTAVVREIQSTCGEAWGPGHPPALFVPTDVTSPADCQGAVTAAMETFGRLDVRVNCIAPGSVETPMLHREWEEMGGEAGVRHLFEEKHPLGRISQPEEVAAAILFLASADASFINGVCLPVDAGLTAG